MLITEKKTKIVATIGPASESKEMIEKLVRAGVNIFRINTSHGNLSIFEKVIRRIRDVEKKLDTYISVLLDLQGPKIRIGKFKKGFIEIYRGQRLIFTTERVLGDNKIVPIKYQNFPHDVKVGNRILLDDGNLTVQVMGIEKNRVTVEVVHGGTLSNNKGLNLPESSISTSPITDKDKANLTNGIKCGVDFVALSFVKNGEDIRALRKLINDEGSDAEIIAKIERHEAVKNLDEIIEEADGVMVARGDLGIEIPYARVPLVQNEILAKANRQGKPVIVATQMLESMIQSHRATRAEISDVANAVADYADALMLSAETAVGLYPVVAVETMVETAVTIEKYQASKQKLFLRKPELDKETPVTHGITYVANQLAQVLDAKAVIAFTESGHTVKHISKHKPDVPIYAFTPHARIARRLTLTRAANPYPMGRVRDIKKPLKYIFDYLKKRNLVQVGERVILISGLPMRVSGTTNMVRVERVR